jgi:hypothetical protein
MQKYSIVTLSILVQVVNKNELLEASRMSDGQKFSIV